MLFTYLLLVINVLHVLMHFNHTPSFHETRFQRRNLMLRDLNLTFGVAQLTIHCAHEDTEALGVQGRNPPQRRARGIWLPSSSASQNVKTAVFVGPPPPNTHPKKRPRKLT